MTTLPDRYTEEVVAVGIKSPTATGLAPDGRLWVLDQGGEVKVFRDGNSAGLTALTIPAPSIDGKAERGLLGIAFDPAYDLTGPAPDHVYLYYTSTAAPAAHNRISRFEVDNTDPDRPTLSGEVVLVELDPLSDIPNHNGGAIHFGSDGKLYVGVGDNTDASNSQNLGKMLRYNPDGTIPADNPTTFPGVAGTPAGADRAI